MGQGPPQVTLELMARFERNIDSYRSQGYNETQLRREFIDPFFEVLGWDVANKAGNAEAYKDVVHEDAIKVAGATKAPDYCFRIGGARKFFLEAKKPAVNLKDDASPAYQLRRYAWSAKLPLSILSNFEEFAAYDCRTRPNPTDKSGAGRILYMTYKDYTTRWGEIAEIFSKGAVLKGSFDKFAVSERKRGTATVDAEFLTEIEGWRDTLAHNLALRNPDLPAHDLNFAVQRTIDRLIFLRICEDRGIETHGQLRALLNGENVYGRLRYLYGLADDRYNSGLFHFRQEKGRAEAPDVLTPTLTIDDKVLKDIIRRLYYPDSPYEFSVFPAEILGHVYEQFLGKVIRLTPAHRAVVEEKPEVKKAGGVYYTPAYIVDYIVKHTVGRLCEGKTPKQIAKLRVLDPACGSGSFLIGAYGYLLSYHRDWYVKDGPAKHTKEILQDSSGEWRLTTQEKKRILLSNIYGVDIDGQAVEVTKLSLLLKVLEGESQETLRRQLSMWRERALPDLGRNIKCGNSLIGPDYFAGQLALDRDAIRRINPFDWRTEFPEVMKAGGFDQVIGNPPYIRIQRIPHDESDYFFEHYTTPTSKTDLSQLFLERALSLTTKNGLIGFICTSQWTTTNYGRKMRAVLSDGRLHQMIDFGSLPVFEGADTYPAIFLLSPTPASTLRVKRIQHRDQLNLRDIELTPASAIPLDTLSEAPWNLGGLDIAAILTHRKIASKPLSVFGQAYIGLLTGMDAAFIVDAEVAKQSKLEAALLLPYAYRGEEITRYTEVRPSARVIYPYYEGAGGAPQLIPESHLRTMYPNIHRHLLAHKEALRKRKDSRRHYALGVEWYRQLRPGSFKYIRAKKFVVKGIDTRVTIGLLEENTAFNGANCPGIILEDLQGLSPCYFLGMLNSRVTSYWLRSVCPAKLGGYSRFNAGNINNVPIRAVDPANRADKIKHDRMVLMVNRLLDLHRQLGTEKTPGGKEQVQRQIEATEREIDWLVYALYGLTEEEIRTVEEAIAK